MFCVKSPIWTQNMFFLANPRNSFSFKFSKKAEMVTVLVDMKPCMDDITKLHPNIITIIPNWWCHPIPMISENVSSDFIYEKWWIRLLSQDFTIQTSSPSKKQGWVLGRIILKRTYECQILTHGQTFMSKAQWTGRTRVGAKQHVH